MKSNKNPMKPEHTYANELWEKSELPKGWKLQLTDIKPFGIPDMQRLQNSFESTVISSGFIQIKGGPGPRGPVILMDNDGSFSSYLHPILLFKQ